MRPLPHAYMHQTRAWDLFTCALWMVQDCYVFMRTGVTTVLIMAVMKFETTIGCNINSENS